MPSAPAPISPPTHTSSGVRRVTRDELLALARSGNPWSYLALVPQLWPSLAHDAELCFLTAAAFAKVGLRTLAIETLGRLPGEARQSPAVSQVAALIDRLPSDEISAGDRISVCLKNLDSLGARAGGVRAYFDEWAAGTRAWRAFRTLDGSVVRCTDAATRRWVGLTDQRAIARGVMAALSSRPGYDATAPHVLEGIDPPWTFEMLADRLARQATGYIPSLTVLQRDAAEMLDGLSLADLSGLLRCERVEIFAGEHAQEHWKRRVLNRLDYGLPGAYVPVPGTRSCFPSPAAIYAEAHARWASAEKSLSEEVDALYAGRDRAWWSRRYSEALSGGPALRVLLPTCRFTTFVQHSSADLADALRARGCECDVLIEPDDSSRLSRVAYLRRIAAFKPDLIVMVNYPRRAIVGGHPLALPANVPFVCWVQDAMPHLFTPNAGRSLTGLDFLVGHLHGEFFESYGYPRERSLAFPVVASARKFHAGPVPDELRRAHECEIAYVSHHSETVENMHARLCAEAGHPRVVRVMDSLLPEVRAIAEAPEKHFLHGALKGLISGAIGAEFGNATPSDPKLATTLLKNYAVPIAERAVRHQTLEWAAEIADRRGWRVHLYGRGWDAHPRFARFAKGALPHDDALRCSYACAAAHLHASVHFLGHQRVLECVLAGGYPVVRLNRDELSALHWAAVAPKFARRDPPDRAESDSGRAGYTVADDAGLMRLTSLRQRLGLACDPVETYSAPRRAQFEGSPRVPHPHESALWLLGDNTEQFFASPEQLEARLAWAIENADRRRSHSALARRRVESTLTHGALADQIIGLVVRGLA